MKAITQMVRATVRSVVRDLGTVWVKSLITRAILGAVALLALIVALAFLLASAHTALSRAVGGLYANLIIAAVFVAIAAGLFMAGRVVKKRAELRRQAALNTVSLMVGTLQAAASTAASRNALVVVAAALAAGFFFGNASGDSSDEDE